MHGGSRQIPRPFTKYIYTYAKYIYSLLNKILTLKGGTTPNTIYKARHKNLAS